MTSATRPAAGPHRPLAETPELGPNAVRRTTSTDVVRPDGFDGTMRAEVRGRDLRRGADGRQQVVDQVDLVLEIDAPSGEILSLSGGTPPSERPSLEGLNVRRGFGRALAAAMPEGAIRRPLLFSVLEDLNGAVLVSGYAPLREGRLPTSVADGVARAEVQQDICAGWARGGAVVELLRSTGETAVPMGPPAPPITAGLDRWHQVPAPPTGTVRRLRCLDVDRSAVDPATAGAWAHFRDSYVGADEEMVMHEYLVRASFDRHRLVMDAVDVEARVLPWSACPAAVGSASALVGTRIDELPGRVRAELVGPPTCTHLNSTMRSLADVHAMLRVLDEGPAR